MLTNVIHSYNNLSGACLPCWLLFILLLNFWETIAISAVCSFWLFGWLIDLIIDFMQGLLFAWAEALTVENVIKVLAQIYRNIQQCQQNTPFDFWPQYSSLFYLCFSIPLC